MTDSQYPQPVPTAQQALDEIEKELGPCLEITTLRAADEALVAAMHKLEDAYFKRGLPAFETAAEHIEHAAGLIPAPEGAQLPNVAKTAPAKIHLVIGAGCPPEADFTDCDEVTWCKDKVDANSITYIRADLAAQPQQSANPNNCDGCDHKRNPDGGWCYMFRDEPTDVCAKHTARTSLQAPAPVGEVVEMDDGALVPVWRDGTPAAGTKLYAGPGAAPAPAHGRMPAGSARALIARLTAAVRGDDGDEIEAAMTAVSDALQRPWEARFAPAAVRQLMDTFNGEGWRKESDDTDALLKHLGLEPETCRTEGGWLNLPRIKSLLGQCCEKAAGPGRVCADCAAASRAYSADMAPVHAPAHTPCDEHLMNFLAPWVIADDPKDRADFLAALRAALAFQAPAVGADWRPIETAPTDGTRFWAYRERDGKMAEAYRVPRNDCEMWYFGGTSAAVETYPGIRPSHWMPLPAAPISDVPVQPKGDAE